jgi:hypothetical protein
VRSGLIDLFPKDENRETEVSGFRFFLFFRPIFAAKKLAYFGFFVFFCRKAYFFPKYFVTLPLVLKWLMYNIL